MKNLSSAFLLAFILAVFTIPASGQQIKVGVRAGYLWANAMSSESGSNLTSNFESIRNNEFAAFVDIPILSGFSIQPELAYTTKGFAYDQAANVDLFNTNLPIGAKAKSNFRYIEAPVLAKYTFNEESAFRAYLAAGPTFGYATEGEVITTATAIVNIRVGTTPIDLDGDNFNRFEIGGVVGGGIELDAGFATFFADARYKHGFTDVYDVPVIEDRVRNKGVNVNLGLAIPIGN